MYPLLTGRLTVERIQVKINDLPTALKGCTLTQLSDFHFDGLRLPEKLLAKAIAASNAANPDLVLLTGDFVTDDPDVIHSLTPWLQKLESRSGIYAALGNHDNCFWRSRSEITSALTDIGINVLWNRIAYPFDADLALVGLADFWSREFDPAPVMAQLDNSKPRIVLSHNPDAAVPLQQWRVDLQLSGHTHGGQIVLPFLGPISPYMAKIYRRIPKRAQRRFSILKESSQPVKHWEWSEGLHSVNNNLLYVNRGLGTYLPGRFRCPPEVTIITLI